MGTAQRYRAALRTLVGTLLLAIASAQTGCTKYTLPPGWEYKWAVDSSGFDVMNSGIITGNWTELIAKCDATPGCKYLNTWGWLKYQVNTYYTISTSDPCKGMLIRQGDPPIPLRCVKYNLTQSGWDFKQGVDSSGNDIIYSSNTAARNGDWNALIQECDVTPGCKYANTGGWYKYKIGTLGNPTTTDPCKGLLVRIGDPPVPLRCVKYTLPSSGWEFKQGVDSYGNDIGNSGVSADWAKLIAACDAAAAAGCVAVTTGGWVKTKVGSLVKTNDDNPCSGLLVRTGPYIPPSSSPSPSPRPSPSPSPSPPPSPAPPAVEAPLAAAPATSLDPVDYRAKVPVGTNLPRLDQAAPHYGGSWAAASTGVFTDLFKHATPFECVSASTTGNTWGWGNPAYMPLRADGYPAEIQQPESWRRYAASSRVGGPGEAFYDAGKYVLVYDGQGKIEVDGDAAITWQAAGRIGLAITPANGFSVRILATNTTNPVTNISVVPAAKEVSFSTDIYQPAFLRLLNGLKVLRFTQWQRVWGDANNAQMRPRTLEDRSTPSSHSYMRKDGVAVEHMVALANKVQASPFFSMPVASNSSDPYISNMAKVVADKLDTKLKVYIEFGQGGPGWMTTALAANLISVARIWRRVFTEAGADPARVLVVATYESASWIPYFYDTFTADEQAEVNAIGVVGVYGPRSWDSNRPCYYAFNDATWLKNNTNITYDKVVNLTRSSVIHGDLLHNRWANRLKARGKALLALQGGPDIQMQAPYYSMRMNYQSLAGCTTYPCTRSNLYGMNPSSVTLGSEADRNALMDSILPVATAEYNLDEMLMQVKLRDPATKDHMLDFLHRWQLAGGDAMVVNLPAPTSCSSGPGTKTLVPTECQTNSTVTKGISPDSSPIYQAVRAFITGGKGQLPLTSNWSVEAATCSPACTYGTCIKGKCSCYAGFEGAACDTATTRLNQCNNLLGINLEGVSDWSHSWTFVDVMKHGRAWLSQGMDGSGGWGNTSGVALMQGDYPATLEVNQKAGSILIRDLQGHIPAGTYTLMYDGDGVVDCGAFDVAEIRHLSSGLAEIDVKPSTGINNGLFITVERTNPANPIRNIRVLMPGFDAARAEAMPFHPRFLSTIKPFGVVRFMDLMSANTAGPKTWSERARTSDRSFAGHRGTGIPLEYMVKLVNHVGAAPWFTLNHMNDDDFHRQFATQVKATLRADVKVYVEWSNEAWHTGFEGGKFAQAEGLRLNMIEQGSAWFGGATNEARLCYIAERTKVMSQIWKEVFADEPDRVVVVVSGQTVWPLASEKVFTCRNVTRLVDAFAIGPYFGSWTSADTDLDTFVNKLPAQIDNDLQKYIAPHVAIAKKYGKPLLAYEAGQSLTGDNAIPMQANRHPGMKAAYTKYLNGLRDAGLQHINHYNLISTYSKSGSWGLLEWQDQDTSTSPKYQAVKDFLDAYGTCNATSNSTTSNNTFATNPDGTCNEGCSASGQCIDGQCYCNTGFSGPACNITSYTDVFNCGYKCTFDQGTCAVSSTLGATKYWVCTCKEGFFGDSCSLFKCPRDCSWSGTCLDKGVCACFPGFTGDTCELDCGCNGHGMCSSSGTCLCDAGYKLGPKGCEPDCACGGSNAGCVAPGECGCSQCKNGQCFNGRCECWAGFTGAGCTELKPSARANLGSPVGVEVGGPAYWSTQWIFTNIMAQSSSGWWTQRAADRGDVANVSTAFDSGIPLDLTPEGYPRSLPDGIIAHKLAVRNVQLRSMPGRYVALWDGDGIVDIRFDAKVTSVSRNRLEFDYSPTANPDCWATGAAYCGDNGMWIVLRATNPANPVRNLRIVPKALEGLSDRLPFHPWFLKDLERFSVLRFMSWLGTNSDAFVPWAQRTTPAHDSQARPGGLAWEYLVLLCNQLGASPWINIHHLADDDYVRNVALFLKENLRPDVSVFVEHSNEVWNTGFPQGKYARKRGLELGLSTQEDLAGYRYHGKRSGEIFDIFTDVFGPEQRTARLKYIVGSWGFICSGSWGTGCGATAINTTLGYADVVQKADALGVTAYFGCGLGQNGAADALLSVDDMMAKCMSDTELEAMRTNLLVLKRYAAAFGLPLVTYEAGPSIVEQSVLLNGGGSQAAALKYIALQRDSRFEAVYAKYLKMFDEVGLVNDTLPLMHFTSAGYPSKFGSWGLLEYTGQDLSTAPKARALFALLDLKQPASIRVGCLDPDMGVRGLADAQYSGAPAILSPAKGAVWIQGLEFKVTFPSMRAPAGSVTVDVFKGSDCNTTALSTFGPLAVSQGTFDASVTIRVPAELSGPGYFLRVKGTVNGAPAAIYSEFFDVQPAQKNGECNPNLPYPPPVPRCSPELKWNVTDGPSGLCKVEANGCRSYRTAGTAAKPWYSSSKPVVDCTSQFSPNPSKAALTAAGVPPDPFTAGGTC